MLCDLSLRLTLRLMGLGLSLREAERFAASVMTWFVIVVTIMGCTIREPCDDSHAGKRMDVLSDTIGIRSTTTGSQYCGCRKSIADASVRSPALLTA